MEDKYPASKSRGDIVPLTGSDEIRPGHLKQALSLGSTMSLTDYTPGRTNRFNHIISSELDEFFLLFKEEDSEVSL